MFVYQIICDADISPVTGTGKIYVGKHSGADLQKYLREKFYDSRCVIARQKTSYLYNAMRKYPNRTDWRIHPLMSTLKTDVDIKRWEIELIALTRCQDPNVGYNITAGGEGTAGLKRPDVSERNTRTFKGKRLSGERLHKIRIQLASARINSPVMLNPHGFVTSESLVKGGQISGKRAVESGQLATARHVKQEKEETNEQTN